VAITFGSELRRLRNAAGHTLRSFATTVNVSYGQLSKLETGDRVPTAAVARTLDEALRADGALSALGAELRASRVRTPRAGNHTDSARRRSVLGAAATLAVSVTGLAGVDFDPTHPRRIDTTDIGRLQASLDRMWALDHAHGAAELWDLAVARAHSITLLLDVADYGTDTGAALLDLNGRAYMLAGWLADDAERLDIARTCYTEALAIARQADSDELACHALGNLAAIGVGLERPRQTLRHVAAAECALPAGASVRQASVLRMRRGRAYAQTGDATEASRELTAARRMLDRDNGPVPERLAYFTPAEIDANAAACAMSLHKPQQAVRLLETAIGDYSPRFGRNRALYLVRLAAARAACGHPDGAAESIASALDVLAAEVGSRHVRVELADVTQQLQPHRSIAAVAAVLDRAEQTITA
jgi:transcriptional regulator with XRE-family HTH domain